MCEFAPFHNLFVRRHHFYLFFCYLYIIYNIANKFCFPLNVFICLCNHVNVQELFFFSLRCQIVQMFTIYYFPILTSLPSNVLLFNKVHNITFKPNDHISRLPLHLFFLMAKQTMMATIFLLMFLL